MFVFSKLNSSVLNGFIYTVHTPLYTTISFIFRMCSSRTRKFINFESELLLCVSNSLSSVIRVSIFIPHCKKKYVHQNERERERTGFCQLAFCKTCFAPSLAKFRVIARDVARSFDFGPNKGSLFSHWSWCFLPMHALPKICVAPRTCSRSILFC